MFARSRRSALILSTALAGGLLAVPAAAQTINGVLPTAADANIRAGSATITGGGPAAGATLDVNLTSQRSVIDWFHFDVPTDATARFTNASGSPVAAVLNRVRAGGLAIAAPSTLAGTITAPNVELWIQNGEGFLFGNGLSINSNGFVASVPSIDVGDFTDGDNVFSLAAAADSLARIRGGGTIRTNGGILALVAPQIDVDGSFNAGTGSVAFVTATDATMTASPGSPLGLTVNRGTRVGGDAQLVKGSVAGGAALFVLATQSSVIDAVLNVGANVTASEAVANGRGVTLVAGRPATGVLGVAIADPVDATGGAARIVTGGTIAATGFARPVVMRSTGAITATGDLSSDANVDLSAGGALSLAGARAATGVRLRAPGAITATGALTTIEGAVDAVAGTTVTLQDARSTTGNVVATGTAVTARDLIAGDTATLTATGAITTRSVTATNGIALTSSGGGAIGSTGTLASSAGGLTVATTGAVALNDADVRQAIAIGTPDAASSVTATGTLRAGSTSLRATGAVDVAAATTTAGALTLTSTGGTVRLGTGTAAGGATINAAGAARVGTLTSTGSGITIASASVAGDTTPGATLSAATNAVQVTTTGAQTLGDVTAGTTIALQAGGKVRIEGTARSAGDLVIATPGEVEAFRLASTGGRVTIDGAGVITGRTATELAGVTAAGDVVLRASGVMTADATGATVTLAAPTIIASGSATAGDFTAEATSSLLLGATSATRDIRATNTAVGRESRVTGTLVAGRDIVLTSAGGLGTAGSFSAGRDALLQGTRVTLGDTRALALSAGRLARVVASTGDIVSTAGATLAGDGLGAGIGNAVILDAAAGAITLPGSTLTAGTARQSDVAIRYNPASALVLGNISARTFGITDAAYGAVAAINANRAVTIGNIDVSRPLTLTTTGARLLTGSIRTNDANADVTLRSSGAGGQVGTGDITATGSVLVDAPSAFLGGISATAPGKTVSVTATGTVLTGAVASNSGLTLAGGTVTSGALRSEIGDVQATASTDALTVLSASGRDVTLSTAGAAATATLSVSSIDATGAANVASAGSVTLNRANAAGDITVRAATTLSGPGGGPSTITSSGGNTTLTVGGAASLNTVSGRATRIEAGSINAAGLAATAGALTVRATGQILATSMTATGGGILIDSSGGNVLVSEVSARGGDLSIGGNAVSVAGFSSGGTITPASVSALGRIDLTARSGDLVATSGSTIRSDTAGTGAGGVYLDATGGSISFDSTSSIFGGTDRQSPIGIRLGTAGRTVALGTVSGLRIGSTDAAHSAVNAAVSLDGVLQTGDLSTREALAVTVSRSLRTGNVTVTNAGAGIALNALVGVTTGVLTAPGRIQIGAGAGANIGGAISTDAAVTITGTGVTVANASAATDLSVSAGSGVLSIVGAARANGGALELRSGGALSVGTATGSTGALIDAGGEATLGDVASQNGSVSVTAASGRITSATAGQALTLTARTGELRLDTGTAGTTATVSAVQGTATIASGLTSGGTARVTALDVRARSITSTGANVVVDATGAVAGVDPLATIDADTRADLRAATTVSLTSTGSARLGTVSGGTGVALTTAGVNALTVNGGTGSVAIDNRTGAIVLGTASSAGAITISGGSRIEAERLESTGGSIAASSVEARIATANARQNLDVTATAGDVTLGTGSAGGTATIRSTRLGVTIQNGLTSGGNASVSGVDIRARSITSTGGSVTLEATGAIGGAIPGGSTDADTRADLRAATTVTARAGTDVRLGTVSGGGAVLVTGRAIDATALTSTGGTLTVTGTTGAVRIGTGSSGGAASVTTDGVLTVADSLTAGGDVRLRGSDLRLRSVTATAGALVADATGSLTGVDPAASSDANSRANLRAGTAVTATAGGLQRLGTVQGGTSVTLTGTGIDANQVTATGGPLTINARTGALRLGQGTSGGTASLTAGGDVTVSEALAATGATTASGANLRLARVTTTAGAITLDTPGEVTGVGTGSATLIAGGGTSALTITAGGASRLLNATAAGNLSVRAASILASQAAAGGTLDLNATAGTLSVIDATAGGAAALRSTGNQTIGTLVARGVTLNGGVALTATRITSTGDLAATATGAASLGTSSATGAASVTANGVSATSLTAGTTLSVTSSGATTLTAASGAAGVAIDAAGLATLGTVSGGPSISVRAGDVDIQGAQTATRVVLTNRAPATAALRIGDGTASGGFSVGAAEVNRIAADALVLDGGTGAVEIGTLALNAAAGRRSVDVLTTGRIDVRGVVSGSGVGRTIRLGGTAGSTTALASDIILTATPTAGGRLLFPDAELFLYGGRIAQGQASGFLAPLSGLALTDVANRFVSNASSSLYNAIVGGAAYDAGAQTLLSANRLTVRFTDYALFQNTGGVGENRGAVIAGSQGTGPSLSFTGGSTAGSAGAVAFFGTVEGVADVATALLPSSDISATQLDPRTARVNGCLLGSGAGCLTNVVSQPVLNVFDASRTRILRSEDNLAVPFDPVVSTNNEALFTGVSTIDLPPEETQAPPETCPPGSAEPCPTKPENQP